MKKWTWLVFACILIAPMIIFSVVMKLPTQSYQKDWFAFSINSTPSTFDPALITGKMEMTIAHGIFEGLMSYSPDTLDPVPAAAESVSISGLKYTFKLNKSKWSDGSDITAADFIYSWKRVLTPATGSKYASMLFPIKNAQRFYSGEITDFAQVGVSSSDPLVLTVELERPTPYFLSLTAFVTYLPVKRECVEKFGDKWTRQGNIVCNGPFKLDPSPGNRIDMSRNPSYRAADKVRFARVSAAIVKNDATAVMMFDAGEIDWVTSLPYAQLKQLSTRKEFRSAKQLSVNFIRFGFGKAPFNDPKVREAFYVAIDRNALCSYGGEIPANSFVPDGLSGYRPVPTLKFNAARAGELLAEAGFPGGKGLPEIELLYQSSDNGQVIAQELQSQWKRAFGIEVKLYNVERGTYFSRRKALDYQMCLSDWIGDYPDPQTFLEIFVSGDGNNQTGWGDPEYDALIAKAAGASAKEREKLFREAENILILKGIAVGPLYFSPTRHLVREGLSGFHDNLLNIHPLGTLGW